MKHMEKVLSPILSLMLAMCLAFGSLSALAADSAITWRVEGDTLIYSGTGMVKTSDLAPKDVRAQVRHVVVEPGITKLATRFMDGAENLETVSLPEGLTVIQMDTFSKCVNLRTLNIPSTVTTLQPYALVDLKSLESIELPAGLTSLGESALSNCDSLKRVTIPGGVTEIGPSAFYGCDGLEEVALSHGVLSIGDLAFSRNTSLKQIAIPGTVASIGPNAFSYCASLEEITLPASLTNLDGFAFYGCDNLKKITFLGTQEQWDAFEPLTLRVGSQSPLGDPPVFYTGAVECLGTGTAVSAQVTFDPNGGTVSQTRKDVVYGEPYGPLPTPVNGNKIFYGWYTQPQGGRMVTALTPMNELEDHTLYAQWSLDTSALTPAKAGTAFLPDRDPFDPRSPLTVTKSFSAVNGSNASCEGGSYLYANEKGGLTRIQMLQAYSAESESYGTAGLVITELDEAFNVTAQGTVPFELERWGGFYGGERYNFLVFGQNNMEKDNRAETVRVVKYDKNWNRLGHGSVYGSDILIPFLNGTDAGDIGCTEHNGFFYIHAGRGMYNGHQACMTLAFREGDMENTYACSSLSGFGDDYVSHAYEQRILVDREGRLVSLDLGDGYPRAVVLHQYQNADLANGRLTAVGTAPNDISNILVKNYHVQEIPGEAGKLNTGCTVAGMVETEDYYLVVYQYDPAQNDLHSGDLSYQFVDKETLTGATVKLADAPVRKARVFSVDSDSGYIIWTAKEDGTFYYAPYGNGTVGSVRQAEGYRSGCTPILYQDKLVWSVDIIESDGKGDYIWQPTEGVYSKRFYTLDPATGAVAYQDYRMIDTGTSPGPSATPSPSPSTPPTEGGFTDVPAGKYYSAPVAWAVKQGITSGTSATTFSPNAPCTRVQIMTFLWIANGRPAPKAISTQFTDMPDNKTFQKAISWAVEKKITAGVSTARFGSNNACTRGQAMVFLWVAAGRPQPKKLTTQFTDMPQNKTFQKAISWAVENKITGGTSQNTFSPNAPCTRAQIVTFLWQVMKN